MRKVKNAFIKALPDYNCFACSPNNEQGLHMEFFTDDETVWSEWTPKPQFDGWTGVVHGGIQATLMDETSEWFIFVKHGRSAVTMELNCKYKKPLSSVIGKIKIIAKEVSFNRNICEIETHIFDSENQLCSQSFGKFYVFSEEESKNKYFFPGKEQF